MAKTFVPDRETGVIHTPRLGYGIQVFVESDQAPLGGQLRKDAA